MVTGAPGNPQQQSSEQRCAGCGRPMEVQGYQQGGQQYCCQECASGGRCQC